MISIIRHMILQSSWEKYIVSLPCHRNQINYYASWGNFWSQFSNWREVNSLLRMSVALISLTIRRQTKSIQWRQYFIQLCTLLKLLSTYSTVNASLSPRGRSTHLPVLPRRQACLRAKHRQVTRGQCGSLSLHCKTLSFSTLHWF